MFKIIAVSNRHICSGDFYDRIREITRSGIDVILREKDMMPDEYRSLLAAVGNPLIIPHTFADIASEYGYKRIHLPLGILRRNPDIADKFSIGVSIHSSEEAKEAQSLGASYVTAGHIFATDCKKGLPGRGLGFIKAIKSAVNIPVYAIGGINAENISSVKAAGADGVCIMSGFMRGNWNDMLRDC